MENKNHAIAEYTGRLIGFVLKWCIIITLILIALKACNIIAASWLSVFTVAFIGVGIFVVGFVFSLVLAVILSFFN